VWQCDNLYCCDNDATLAKDKKMSKSFQNLFIQSFGRPVISRLIQGKVLLFVFKLETFFQKSFSKSFFFAQKLILTQKKINFRV